MPPLQSMPILEYKQLGIYPDSTHARVIGHDFVYDWRRAEQEALKRNCNLDTYLTAPLANRLTTKNLRTPVTFWYAALNNLFFITVCSPRSVNFCDPLLGLHGYVEYGGNYLRPHAKPFLHWNGSQVIRTHTLESVTKSEFFISDFGSAFGLTVSECDEDLYSEIEQNPAEHFEYSAVPSISPTSVTASSEAFQVHHALCISR